MISNKLIILVAFIALINCILASRWRIRCSDGRVCSGHNTVAISYAECCNTEQNTKQNQVCSISPD